MLAEAWECGREEGRYQLAHQIAEGTHEVVWSTNEFGTLEVRIEEVKGTK